jgi:hypothetical protein
MRFPRFDSFHADMRNQARDAGTEARLVRSTTIASQYQENAMRYALVIAAVAGICAAVPASAEEVGVGVGPVGVTVGAGHDRDRDRDHDRTIVRDRDEHRDRDTVIIKKDHDRDGDRDHDKTIIDRR